MPSEAMSVGVWVALPLALWGAHLVYGFVRAAPIRNGVAVGVAIAAHVLAFARLPQRGSTSTADAPLPPVRVRRLPPPPPPPEPVPEVRQPPEPEPETAPEPEPRPIRERPEPRDEPREPAPKTTPPPTEAPADPAPEAAPKTFDLTQLDLSASSGVVVRASVPGQPSGSGPIHARGTGRAPGGSGGSGEGGAGSAGAGNGTPAGVREVGRGWKPISAAAIAVFPRPLRVAKRSCPATRQGVHGVVALRVQVRDDGGVRRVDVTEGIGHGCDEIAKQALERARFAPAKDQFGRSADFEIARYEYEFRIVE